MTFRSSEKKYYLSVEEVPDSQVVKTTASQGHKMYCLTSRGHGFEPLWGRTWGA